MWYSPPKYTKNIKDFNEELKAIKGELDDKQARITLGKFLRRNIGFTTELIMGIKLAPYQIVTIKGMLERNYGLCVWGRGVGKSILYNIDNQVITKDKGMAPITSLFPNLEFQNENYWHEFPEIELWNGNSWQKTNKILVQKGKQATNITTRMGYSLTGSTVHKIKAIDKKTCSIIWKRYDELKTGDFVCISRNQIPIENLSNITENEAYFCGLAIGDGCYSEKSNGLTITSEDEEIKNFCISLGAIIRKDNRTDAVGLAFNFNFKEAFLSKFELEESLSYSKYIPSKILLNKSLLKSCLQGLFDTDGGIERDGRYISFCSTSKYLARQVHLLLLTFGIISKLREKETQSNFGKAWIVQISGENALKFYQNIGFRLTRKQKGIEAFQNSIFNTNVDVVPGAKEFGQLVKSKCRLPKVLSDEWRDKIRRDNQLYLSHQSLDNYLNFFKKAGFEEEDYKKLTEIQNKNFFFDEVESINHSNGDFIDFNVPNGEMYWANGFINHNTFCAAVYCVLQTIFEPNTNILIAGPTFRTARFIFNHIEKMADKPGAQLLAEAMGIKSKRNDEFKWAVNGGEIVAIPLNGEKIRGFRANILLIDEFLLMGEEMVEKVLTPYLVAPQNVGERIRIRAAEDELIRKGVMKESERIVFPNKAKMIALSSASYTCEYLYTRFDEYQKAIYSDKISENGVTYFISQMAWDSIPAEMIDKSVIEVAQGREASTATFNREYGAQFIDGSDSYFSMNKMIACTVPDGQEPTLLLRGEKGQKCILAIDPNFSNSETADHFAMCVIALDDDAKGGTVVHQYARAGKDLKDHIAYFYHIMTSFDIDMIIIDYAGYQFIESANESELFRKIDLELKIFDFTAEKDGAELEEELKKARRTYNRQQHRIVFTQYFTSDFIRKGNEHLQGCIDYKKIWFGGSIKGNMTAHNKAISAAVDLNLIKDDDSDTLIDIIDQQEIAIRQTKYQCAAIEVKTTAKGVQSFDLPQIMKRDSTSNRIRRDSYTALMLGCWGMKSYHDIMLVPDAAPETFIPFMIG